MQVSQMAKEMSEMRASQGSSKLPSQTINPRENASAITLRSVRQVEEPRSKVETSQSPSHSIADPLEAKNAPIVTFKEPLLSTVPAPFPSRLAKPSKDAEEREILETFRKVQVTHSLNRCN